MSERVLRLRRWQIGAAGRAKERNRQKLSKPIGMCRAEENDESDCGTETLVKLAEETRAVHIRLCADSLGGSESSAGRT